MNNLDKVKTYLLAASGRRIQRNVMWVDDVPSDSFTLPKYEVEILDQVKRENTLACLHSNASKNFLLINVIREHSSGIQRSIDDGGQRIVCLTMEEDPMTLAEVIHRHLPLDVRSFGIEHGVLLWKKEEWIQEMNTQSIFVMHPTVFHELLNRNYIEYSQLKLLILDECHQAIRDHAYGSLVKQYKQLWDRSETKTSLPRLFSITTALLKTPCTPAQLEERLDSLRRFFCSTVFTATDLICRQSSRWTKVPKETIVVCEQNYCKSSEIELEIVRELHEALNYLNQLEPSPSTSSDENPSPLTIPRQVLTECLRLIDKLGIWALLRSSLPFITQLERLSTIAVEQNTIVSSSSPSNGTTLSLSSPRAYSLFLDWTCTLLRLWRSRIKTVIETLDSQTLIQHYTTPKLRSLFEILKRFKADATNPSTRRWSALIFVDRKQETAVLNAILKDAAKRFGDEYSFIRPNFLIGYSTMQPMDDLSTSQHIQPMDSRKQEEVMRKFRMGENNIIVALSSLEELKDIPDCHLVIRFNVPTNYRSYIQSKGKARAQAPHFYMLAEQTEYETFLNNLNSFKGIEKVLTRDFDELNVSTSNPNERERSPNAIEVINKYCARLPCDALTTLVPSCEIRKIADEQYQCILSLPVNSPARTTIQGPVRSTIKQAKLSAAKRMCEHLLQAGELNEHLLAETREQFYLRHSVIDDDDMIEWGSYIEPNPKPGSIQRKQLYHKAVMSEPISTSHASDFFVYAIEGELTTPLAQLSTLSTTEQHKANIIYTSPNNGNRIGLLSANFLLEIPAFSLFSRAGEETFNLQMMMKNQRFTSEEYRMLQTVHYYVFSSILGFDRPLVNFNPDQSQSHLILVLLTKDSTGHYVIDWTLTKSIIQFIQSMYLQKYTLENPYRFNPSDFNPTSIVLPTYRRSTQPQYYIVNSIDTNKNPLSPFPSASTIYDTFSSYYEIKYELRLTNKTQPLLCVSHASHRMNQLIPRYMNFKMLKSSSGTRANHRPGQHTKTSHGSSHHHHQGVFLIPELVILHPINAQLWQGIIALPSMLYRIHSLMLVEQLRRTVALETGVGAAWAPEDGQFDKLGFDWDEKKEAQFSALLDNNDTYLNDEPIDPNWNFEISVWKGEESNPWINDSEWSQGKGGCFMFNAAEFEDGDFDEMDLDDDDDDEHPPHQHLPSTSAPMPSKKNSQLISNWSNINTPTHQLSSSDDDDDDDEEDEKKPNPTGSTAPAQSKENPPNAEVKMTNYQIDLTRLHDDLKAKSKKFLSKLMASTQPTTATTNQEEIDLFSSIQIPPTSKEINENHLKKSIDEPSNYLGNVQIEDTIQLYQSPVASVIHFEPTPLIKRMLNIDDVLHDDVDEDQSRSQSPSSLPPSSFLTPASSNNTSNEIKSVQPILLENGHDSGIIDDFTDPLNINLDFEYLPESHPGPSPALLLQALTLSNAGDGFDLERLETVGDSFLKQAVTVYIYCTYTHVHEGKLSFFRSKIVSNYNLYKLGKRKSLGEYLISTKFEPFENWIPPLFVSGSPTEYGYLSASGVELWTKSESTTNVDWIELQERREQRRLAKTNGQTNSSPIPPPSSSVTMLNNSTPVGNPSMINDPQWTPSYDRRTQHLISDKSIADAVEALIGAYLIASGPKAALRFMAWLGVRIFPKLRLEDGTEMTGELPALYPPVDYSNPSILATIQSYDFDHFEQLIGYRFHQRAYLIQAFTHASYSYNTITDCYQRLEFLGDAVLDYVITRYLYEHPKRHSPGELTDLRSALVNNNIFAYIAVKYDFHKYFRCHSNELFLLIDKFVQAQKDKLSWSGFDECNLGDDDDENDEFFYYDFLTSSASNNKDTYSHGMACTSNIDDEHLSNHGDEQDEDTLNEPDEWEETEVPKCLGDIFESVAGAIFLDSNKSFNTVWKVYYRMLKPFIEKFTTKVPKSPIRELLELEPETVKFEKPERLLDGRIRVTVEILGKGRFKGVGRNYRIAKNAAAKCALKNLRRLE